jgi:chromosome segregation ATPase
MDPHHRHSSHHPKPVAACVDHTLLLLRYHQEMNNPSTMSAEDFNHRSERVNELEKLVKQQRETIARLTAENHRKDKMIDERDKVLDKQDKDLSKQDEVICKLKRDLTTVREERTRFKGQVGYLTKKTELLEKEIEKAQRAKINRQFKELENTIASLPDLAGLQKQVVAKSKRPRK